MSVRIDVLLWAQRVLARHGAPAHQILDLPPTASLEEAQHAFHEIARKAHPDLHRRELNREELETVELAYARAAGAYQDFRAQRMLAMRSAASDSAGPSGRARSDTANLAAAAAAATSPSASAGRMNSKATLYYRKAELCLRRGDLRGALLQMKMAIAGDPQSTFLRSALAELEAALSRK